MRGLSAGLAAANGRADFSADSGAPAIRPGPQAAGPASGLPPDPASGLPPAEAVNSKPR